MAAFAESLGLEEVNDSALKTFKTRIVDKLIEHGVVEDYRKFGQDRKYVADCSPHQSLYACVALAYLNGKVREKVSVLQFCRSLPLDRMIRPKAEVSKYVTAFKSIHDGLHSRMSLSYRMSDQLLHCLFSIFQIPFVAERIYRFPSDSRIDKKLRECH